MANRLWWLPAWSYMLVYLRERRDYPGMNTILAQSDILGGKLNLVLYGRSGRSYYWWSAFSS